MNYLSQNLTFLKKKSDKTQADIALQVNKGVTTISNWEKNVSEPDVEELQILSNYFEVSIDELINVDLSNVHLNEKDKAGKKRQNVHLNVHPSVHLNPKNKGFEPDLPVLNEPVAAFEKRNYVPIVVTIDKQGNDTVVMVPVKARAGYLTGYGDAEFIKTLPSYNLPGLKNGIFRMFEVDGLSMHPTLNSGDVVICSNVEQLRDVRDDRLHVVVTKSDGIVVKRVLNRVEKDGKLILKSDNYKDREMYPTLVVDPAEILEIWYCTGYISRQMRPPAETYNRLLDLEARFTLLETEVKRQAKK